MPDVITPEAAKSADRVFDAISGWVKSFVEKRLAITEERLRALETGGTLDSHARRLDRHSQHLAALETRLKKIELERT